MSEDGSGGAPEMSVSPMDQLKGDVQACFEFAEGQSIQSRCHEYLSSRRVPRHSDRRTDSATWCVVEDMVERAYCAGRSEGRRCALEERRAAPAAEPAPEGDAVLHPPHYEREEAARGVSTAEIVEGVIEGLPAKDAWRLASVLKYALRAGYKGPAAEDVAKANNFAHRLVTGEWKWSK